MSTQTYTVAEFLESLSLTPNLENRKRAYGLIQTYALQTGTTFEHQPQNYQLVIPSEVRDVLAQTWILSAEIGLPPSRLLHLWLHHRQAMLTYFGKDLAPAPEPATWPLLLEMAATLRRLRPELLLEQSETSPPENLR